MPKKKSDHRLATESLGPDEISKGGHSGLLPPRKTHVSIGRECRNSSELCTAMCEARYSAFSVTRARKEGKTRAPSYQSDRRFSRDDCQLDPSRRVLLAALLLNPSHRRRRSLHPRIQCLESQSSIASSSSSDGREAVFRERLVEVPTEEVRVDEALRVGDGRDLPGDDG